MRNDLFQHTSHFAVQVIPETGSRFVIPLCPVKGILYQFCLRLRFVKGIKAFAEFRRGAHPHLPAYKIVKVHYLVALAHIAPHRPAQIQIVQKGLHLARVGSCAQRDQAAVRLHPAIIHHLLTYELIHLFILHRRQVKAQLDDLFKIIGRVISHNIGFFIMLGHCLLNDTCIGSKDKNAALLVQKEFHCFEYLHGFFGQAAIKVVDEDGQDASLVINLLQVAAPMHP